MGLPSALRPRAFWRRAEAFAQAGRRVVVRARFRRQTREFVGRDEPLPPSSRIGYNVPHGAGICKEGR
jgi:hypothetical protein